MKIKNQVFFLPKVPKSNKSKNPNSQMITRDNIFWDGRGTMNETQNLALEQLMPSLLPELIQTPARNNRRKEKFVKVLNHSVITFADEKLSRPKYSARVQNETKVKRALQNPNKINERSSRNDVVNPIYL